VGPAEGLVVSAPPDRLLRPGARLPAPPRLFAIDVDGTLLTSAHEVRATTAAQVRRVRATGVEVLLASSRGPGAMRPVVDALGMADGSVFVGAQGGFTGGYDGGDLTTLHRCPAPVQAARQVVAAATSAGLAVGWYAGARWLVSHVDPTIEREARVVHDTPQVADLLAEDDGPDKLLVIAPTPAQVDVLHRIAETLPDGLAAQVSNPTYLEVTAADVDKSSAVRRYCTERRIAPSAVVAIGDGPNDLGLFAYAGTSVAPVSARPEVAAAATWLTRGNDDDGVAWALSVLVPQ
jgi:Cof subfamily protein (haloacid dehalogenase superfamily)